MLIVWITALKFCAELSNTGLQFPADRLRVYSRPSKVLLRDDPHIDYFFTICNYYTGKDFILLTSMYVGDDCQSCDNYHVLIYLSKIKTGWLFLNFLMLQASIQ